MLGRRRVEMADKTLASMDAVTPLTGAELIYVDQASADRKATVDQIKAFAIAGIDTSGGSTGGAQAGEWTYNATTMQPPASGQIRLNNVNPTVATEMYVSNMTAQSVDTSL